MSINPAVPEPEDPHVAATIARAERRRGRLERLAEIGMDLAEQVGAHAAAAMSAINEDKKGDPVRAFAVVSRTIRMTLALETRFDDHVLAMRRGEFAAPRRTRASAAAETLDSATAAPAAKRSDPRRDRVDAAVREAICIEVRTITEAHERLDALNERLFDAESYDALLDLPLRDAVAAVCADLGLKPDWTLWTDDTGFVAPPGRRRVDWPRLCAESYPPSTRAKSPEPHRRQ